MAKRIQQTYAPFPTVTPKIEAWFCNLTEPDQYNEKYDVGIVVDDSPACQAMIDKLVTFQNDQLTKDGRDTEDTLLCLKDEKTKNDVTGKWEDLTGRKLLFFKTRDMSKVGVVGADKKPTDPANIRKGDTVRVSGQAAFGYMKGDPYLTLYLNAVQHVEGGGASGVDAFDIETDEPAAPEPAEAFNDDDVDLE